MHLSDSQILQAIKEKKMKAVRDGIAIAVFTCLFSAALAAQSLRPMELEDLFRIRRVNDPQLSPDGNWIAFVITDVEKKLNRLNSDVWLISSSGGEMRRLTNGAKHDRHPRWSPDGKQIAFESNRGTGFQIYVINVFGGEARQLTRISTEATQPMWSPDGKYIAFVSSVFPEFSDNPYREADSLNKNKLDDLQTNKVKARVITKLLYRHWDSWVEGRRQHLFVVPVGGGDPKDLTPGDRDAVPTSSTFSTGDDFHFSPDGKELAYTATPIPVREEAWSTNHDVYVVDLTTLTRRQITTNPAADGFPRYSPDGQFIAYRVQRRAGFEADRWELMLYDRTAGTARSLTDKVDMSVEDFSWTPDSKTLFFQADEKALRPIWSVTIKGNDVKKVIEGEVNGNVDVARTGKMLVFSRESMRRPVEIYASDIGGGNLRKVTRANDDLFSQITFSEPEYVWFDGAGGTKVQMWIVKPPMFDPGRTYPLVFWVHGGPQGAFMDSWHYRWNAELWAAQGYVLALPNPRGSTGFGQKFVDEISRDWGGKVFEDLMNGLAYLEKLPYVDTSRMAAAGASYGGYMMNWFQGNVHGRFKTLVTHSADYNFYSTYGTTEELWFDEWDRGIPWETEGYDKFSPHTYAKDFSTPNLILHGELDFRVPVSEGMQLFTTLQRKGIPSKFVVFPDENHWIQKPLNSEFWHKTVFEWLEEYLKK